MTQIRTLLIGTALTAFAATAAVAQTAQPSAADTSGQVQAQGAGIALAAQGVQSAQPVTPPPMRLTAGSTDPLVQKRDANAQANAEYRASKKASKAALKDQQKAAKSQQGTGPRRQDQPEGGQTGHQQRNEDEHAEPGRRPVGRRGRQALSRAAEPDLNRCAGRVA